MYERIQRYAALIRDVGVILSIPSILYFAHQLYNFQLQGTQAQIAALEEQNKTLSERQYDRAATIIKAQKELYDFEWDTIEKSISFVGDKRVNIRESSGHLLCLQLTKKI